MKICLLCGRPMIDLFIMQRKHKLQFYMVLVPDPMAWKRDALRTSWNHPKVCAFPLFALIQRAINWMMMSSGLTVILVAPMWLHRKWLLNFLFLLVDNPLQLPLVWNLLVQPHEIPSKPEHNQPSGLEVIQRLRHAFQDRL